MRSFEASWSGGLGSWVCLGARVVGRSARGASARSSARCSGVSTGLTVSTKCARCAVPQPTRCASAPPAVVSVLASNVSPRNASPNARRCVAISCGSSRGTGFIPSARLARILSTWSVREVRDPSRGSRGDRPPALAVAVCLGVRLLPDGPVRLDLVDQRGSLGRREHGVELVQRVGRRIVRRRGGRGHLGDARVHLRRVDGPGRDSVGQHGHHALLRGARRLHLRVQVPTDLLDRCPLLGRHAQRVEAHRDEERDAAVVVIAVVLHEPLGHVVLPLGRRRGRRRRRTVRGAPSACDHRAGSEQHGRHDPDPARHRSHRTLQSQLRQ